MMTRTVSASVVSCILSSIAAVSSAQTFLPLNTFPSPAPGSFTLVGTGLPDGRFVLWNGDRVFVQSSEGSGLFAPVASGFAGDPGFAAVSPDGATLILGSGFSGKLYRLAVHQWQNHSGALEIDVPAHYSGVFLSDTLLAMDRGNDSFDGAEIIVVDIDPGKSGRPTRVVLTAPAQKSLVVDKPPFAFSSQIAVDAVSQTFYVMDSNTRELRAFAIADLVGAYQSDVPLDWNTDGVLIGAPGVYFNGGPSGVLADGNLVIGGAEGFGQPGGIQLVDPTSGAIVDTLDPTGTQQYVSVIVNPATDGLIALDGFTFRAYATTGSVGSLPAYSELGLAVLLILCGYGAWRRVRVNAG